MKIISLLLLLLLQPLHAQESAEKPRCLLLYSYHVGYAWNDGVDEGATRTLADHCTIRRFYLDSKRNPDPKTIRSKVDEVMGVVMAWQPDVMIAVDDNASKYVVAPYFKGSDTPVVFCGVNWTAESYGYPYRNVTGMVEVAPIDALLEQTAEAMRPLLQERSFNQIKAHFIDADRLSARKIFAYFKRAFDQRGITLEPHFVDDFDAWKSAYQHAQRDDLILLINHAGIEDWDQQAAQQFVEQEGKTFSVTNHDWMRSLVAMTVAKVPQEQGEWAAAAAIKILQGSPISGIPITRNRQMIRFINPRLLSRVGVSLPQSLLDGARVVR